MNILRATPEPARASHGFTLVELMIVTVIIGLLAALAVPAISRVRNLARVNTFANDLRVGRSAFETYATEKGGWPPDGAAGVPAEMDGYLNLADWNGTTSLGGNWDWDFQQFGFVAGLSVYRPDADAAIMTMVDERIDDGNLTTGNFRARTDGYILVLEF